MKDLLLVTLLLTALGKLSPCHAATFIDVIPVETEEPLPVVHPLEGIPYNFTHIYLLGGACSEMEPYAWVDGEYTSPNAADAAWHSRFFAAANEAHRHINEARPGTVKSICLNEEDAPKYYGLAGFAREFHIQGLQQVQEEVGSEINETLVVTLGEALESDWTPLAEYLRKGGAFFHGGYTGESVIMNLEEYGLTPDEVMYIYFRLEVAGAAQRAGVELCRLQTGNQRMKYGKLTWTRRPDVLPRVELALQGFREACPDIELIEVWEIDFEKYVDYGNIVFKNALQFKEIPDVVFTFYDGAGIVVLESAKEVLTEEEYARFAITGWDNMYPELLKQGKFLTTVDQMVFYPLQGMWKLEQKLINVVQTSGLRSTRSIQFALDLGDTVEMVASTHTISSDIHGFLLGSIMEGYSSNSPPPGVEDVIVTTGLYDVTITEMIPFEGKFDVVLWLNITWLDPRLAWDSFDYDGELHLDPEGIWTPQLHFKNEFDSEELFSSLAMVNSTGWVVMEENLMVTFLCPTKEGLRAFPFDNYDCSIDLSASRGIKLLPSQVYELLASDPHFDTITSISTDGIADYTGLGITVNYNLRFERRPFTAYVRLVIPAVLINLVGFMAFWIPHAQESIALGVTSLLCIMTFRQTVEMPDTAYVTWTEVFLIINVCYQVSVMFIIWGSYSHTHTISRWCNFICRCLHPKQVQRTAKAAGVKASTIVPPNFHFSATGAFREVPANDLIPANDTVPANDMVPLTNQSPASGQSTPKQKTPERARDMDDTDHSFAVGAISSGKDMSSSFHDNGGVERSRKNNMSVSLQENAIFDDRRTSMEDLSNSVHELTRKVDFLVSGKDSNHNPSGTLRRRKSRKLKSLSVSKIIADAIGVPTDPIMEETSTIFTDATSMDWIGRWIIVPSYIIVMSTFVITGWGFYDEEYLV